MKTLIKLIGVLALMIVGTASTVIVAIALLVGWILLTQGLDAMITGYGFGAATAVPVAILALCATIWLHPAFTHTPEKNYGENDFVDSDRTFMALSRKPEEVYTLFVSYDAGHTYSEFRQARHPDELTYATVYFDAMGMRWLLEDSSGNEVPGYSCKIFQSRMKALG
jgi:hypothetical protein